MTTDEYVPNEQDLEVAWIESEASADDINVASAEFERFLARVRQDAALTLAEHFSAEAIDQARQGNPDGADFYRAVATEIENQIPEETP